MTTIPQPKLPAAAPPKPVASAPAINRTFNVSTSRTVKAFKVGIHGEEGTGKSSLLANLCLLNKLDGVADIEGSHAFPFFDASGNPFHTPCIEPAIEVWDELRAWVQSLKKGIYGLDSITRAQDFAGTKVVETKQDSEGVRAKDSIADFRFKAGLTFICDEFRKLLGDMDAAARRGVSLVIVAHTRVQFFQNPDDGNYARYEPRLLDDKNGSNMLQFVQFLDCLAFIDLDKSIAKGKAAGSGTRTIYLEKTPARMCKCRGIPADPIPFDQGSTALWDIILPTINNK